MLYAWLLELVNEICSVMSNCLQPHVLYSPWNSPSQNTGMGSLPQTQVSQVAGGFFTSWATRETFLELGLAQKRNVKTVKWTVLQPNHNLLIQSNLHIAYFTFQKSSNYHQFHFWNSFSWIQFGHSVVSDSFQPHELQHSRPPCRSPTPRVYPNPCPLSKWAIQPSHPLLSPSPPALNLSQRQGLFKWVSLMGTSTSSVRKELCRSLLGQGTVAAKTNCPSQTQALPSLADIVTGWWHPHPAFPRLYFSSSSFRWEGMVSSHQANEWKWHVMISGWKAVKRQGFLTILFFSFPLAG